MLYLMDITGAFQKWLAGTERQNALPPDLGSRKCRDTSFT
jgi:hypothetical protein